MKTLDGFFYCWQQSGSGDDASLVSIMDLVNESSHCKESLASFRFMTSGHHYTVDKMPDDWKHGQTLRSLAGNFSIVLMVGHFLLGKIAANMLAFPSFGEDPMVKIAFQKLVNLEDLFHGRNEVKEDDWTSSLENPMHIVMGELGARL